MHNLLFFFLQIPVPSSKNILMFLWMSCILLQHTKLCCVVEELSY